MNKETLIKVLEALEISKIKHITIYYEDYGIPDKANKFEWEED